MRFGRNYNPVLLVHQMRMAEDAENKFGRELTKRNADNNKETRTPARNPNLMRFGRANNNFLRFGRNGRAFNLLSKNREHLHQSTPMLLIDRPQVRASTNSFLRFGRNMMNREGAPEVMDPILWTDPDPQTVDREDFNEDSDLDD